MSTGDNVDCDQCMNQLNIAAGCSGWSWSVSECHVSAVASPLPLLWAQLMNIPPSLSLSLLLGCTLYSLSAPLLPSALPALGHASQPLLSLEASLFRKSRKCDKRKLPKDICGDFIQSPLLSVNTSAWVLVCPLSNAENVT